MAQSPQRPYIPHRTASRGQSTIAAADFALARPFVPGAEQMHVDVPPSSGAEEIQEVVMHGGPAEMSVAETAMASIETFLVTSQASGAGSADFESDDEFAEEPKELPPLEHFLDPLPPIADFSPATAADTGFSSSADADVYMSEEHGGDFPDEAAGFRSGMVGSDWVQTDWQRYDWKSAAALGDTERVQAEASDAWSETDWEVPSPRRDERPKAPADAIATALDQIARRIRTGDLSLPGDGSVADPATIAATLAALLGVRR